MKIDREWSLKTIDKDEDEIEKIISYIRQDILQVFEESENWDYVKIYTSVRQ